MGLLDELTGVLGGAAGSGATAPNAANVTSAVIGLLQGHGGIGGLAQVFEQKGLGNMMSQWVSTGPNPPMSADQAHQVFGHSQISEIAQKLGINPAMAASVVAAALPAIIDHLTPQGTIPSQQQQQASMGSLLEQGLGMLKNSGLFS